MKVIAVYLCGDELPTALFPYTENDKHYALKYAEAFPPDKPRWMDKTIKEMDTEELDKYFVLHEVA